MDFTATARLAMANGTSLEEVLDQHAEHLASEIRKRAASWTNPESPLNNAVVTGLQIAADGIDPAVNR